jgi:hypothetical protein
LARQERLRAHGERLDLVRMELETRTDDESRALLAELAELRGHIARDNLDYRGAVTFYSEAIAHLGGSDPVLDCRLNMWQAASATVAGHHAASAAFNALAFRTLKQIGPRRHPDVAVEFAARTARILEERGEIEQARDVMDCIVVPWSRWHEPAGLQAARLAGLAQMDMRICRGVQPRTWMLIAQAREVASLEANRLREVQVRVALARALERDHDEYGAEREARMVRGALVEGQFRHRGSEQLLARYGLDLNVVTAGVSLVRMENTTYNTAVSGGTNVSVGGTGVVQIAVQKGDLDGLLDAVTTAGLDADAVADLRAAVVADGSAEGERVSRWRSRWLAGAASTGGKIGVGAAAGLVSRALASYFGLA